MITVEGLSITFGEGARQVQAVRDVSFAVERGESFGLVGESGSGKSTVLRAIAGLVRPSKGRIAIAGQTLGARRTLQDRRLAQMVFQDPYGSLHPRHTVDRILKEPLAIHGLAEDDDRVRAALAEVGLDASFRFRFPHQLSGGQRQRLAIARSL
ncbi:MAG: ATP-binding cassette domain-containing protein, partial [Pseudomonadota bacterium]